MGITKIVIDVLGGISTIFTAITAVMFPAQAWKVWTTMFYFVNIAVTYAVEKVTQMITYFRTA